MQIELETEELETIKMALEKEDDRLTDSIEALEKLIVKWNGAGLLVEDAYQLMLRDMYKELLKVQTLRVKLSVW